MAGRRRKASGGAAPATHGRHTVPTIAVMRRRGKRHAEPAPSARYRDTPHRAVATPPCDRVCVAGEAAPGYPGEVSRMHSIHTNFQEVLWQAVIRPLFAR